MWKNSLCTILLLLFFFCSSPGPLCLTLCRLLSVSRFLSCLHTIEFKISTQIQNFWLYLKNISKWLLAQVQDNLGAYSLGNWCITMNIGFIFWAANLCWFLVIIHACLFTVIRFTWQQSTLSQKISSIFDNHCTQGWLHSSTCPASFETLIARKM